MKKRSCFWKTGFLMLVAAVTFAGCRSEEKPVEPTPDPEVNPIIRLASAEVKSPAEGGDFVVKYEIENPVEGVLLAAKCDAEWIEGLSVEKAGEIAFTVSENTGASRQSEVAVHYEGAESVSFQVIQAEAAPVADAPFTIKVTEIKETTALLSVSPEDQAMTYLYFVKTAAELKAAGIETDDQLFEADKVFLQKDAEYFGDTFANTVKFYSHQGDCSAEQLKNMTPSTAYVIYAYGIELKGDQLTRLTDIERYGFSTKEVPQIDADFDFDITVSGAVADVKVTAKGYDGPFYFDVLKDFTEETDVTQAASALWMKMTAILFEVGYEPEAIISQLCDYKEGTYRYELEGDREYILFSVAISEEMALPCSKADSEKFSTGSISASENQITVSVTDVTSNSAVLVFETTNEDPYAAALVETESIRGMSDQEIIDAYVTGSSFNTVNGNTTIDVPGLNPGTEYTVLAFGYSGGMMTTGFFRCEFSTKAGADIPGKQSANPDFYFLTRDIL